MEAPNLQDTRTMGKEFLYLSVTRENDSSEIHHAIEPCMRFFYQYRHIPLSSHTHPENP